MLDKKPESKNENLYDWNKLNLWLKNEFSEKHPGIEQKLQISPDWFEMSEQEIVKELKAKGYTVEKLEHGELLIK